MLKQKKESAFVAVCGGEEGFLVILGIGSGGRGIGLRLAECSDIGELLRGKLFFALADEPMNGFVDDIEDGGRTLRFGERPEAGHPAFYDGFGQGESMFDGVVLSHVIEEKLDVRRKLFSELVFTNQNEPEGDGVHMEHGGELLLSHTSFLEFASDFLDGHGKNIKYLYNHVKIKCQMGRKSCFLGSF